MAGIDAETDGRGVGAGDSKTIPHLVFGGSAERGGVGFRVEFDAVGANGSCQIDRDCVKSRPESNLAV